MAESNTQKEMKFGARVLIASTTAKVITSLALLNVSIAALIWALK